MDKIKYVELENSDNIIKNVYHISDIHIRQLKRHEEYKCVFQHLYKELKKQGTDNSILVIVGDILHSKNELSPECVELTVDFFTELSNILPIIIIAGNHDANLSNKSRLDSLTPICNNIKDTTYKHYYLKYSGVYSYHNLIIVVNSLLDDIFIKECDIPVDISNKKTSICMWHGTIDKCVLNTGTVLENEYVNCNNFKGYDITMLGDIHKHQYMNKEKTIAYSGSLIQQNYGENLGEHGMIKWNVKKKEGKFIEIKNDYGYCTMLCNTENVVEHNSPYKVPKYPRIRLKISNSIDTVKQSLVIENIKNKYKPIDIVLDRFDDELKECKNNLDTDFIDIVSLEHQQSLLRKYLEKKGYNDDIIQKTLDINNEIYHNNNYLEFNDDWTWKPIKLEFSNMFCYGENNTINFNYLNGIVGILAPNHYGKSSIIDIILFVLYDKMSRGKRTDIINKDKKTFKCSITIKIGEILYRIDRNGSIGKQGLKVNTKFFRIYVSEEGKETSKSLTGEQRKDTQKMIESYIGSYDNCISTIVSLQNREMGMIDMKQTDRKQFLANILKLDVLEQQYHYANNKYKELDTEYKYLTKDYQNNSVTLKSEIKIINNELTDLTKELSRIVQNKKELQEKYEILLSDIIEIKDAHYPEMSKEQLDTFLLETKQELSNINFTTENEICYLEYIENKINDLTFLDNSKKELDINIESLNRQIEERQSRITHISDTFKDEKHKTEITNELCNITNSIDKYKLKTIQYEFDIKQLEDNDNYDNIIYKKELKNISDKKKVIHKEIQHLYQKVTVLDDKVSSTINNIIEKREKLENITSKSILKIMMILDNTEEKIDTESVKEEIKSYQSNMNKLVKYKIKEHNVDDYIQKKKENQIINEDINNKEATLEKYNNIEEETHIKNSESILLKEKITLLRSMYEKTQAKLEKLELNKQQNKNILSQWEDNYKTHCLNVKINDEINEIKMKRKEYKEELNKILINIEERNELYLEKDKAKDILINNDKMKLEKIEEIKNISEDIQYISYYQNNKEREDKRKYYKNELDYMNKKESELINIINDLKISISIKEQNLEDTIKKGNRISELDKDRKVLKVYTDTMGSKTGLQMELISKALPILESNINKILYSIAEYTIQIHLNENNIEINIVYPGNQPWSIELACGFEKFFTSISMRIAIMNITRKNKPSFFAIDEGWSNLDADNLGNIDKLLYFLKTNFKMVFVISHIDSIKGDLDKILSIEKKDGYSYIHN